MERFRHESVEHILLLLLDTGYHLIGEEILSKGTANAALLSPREVFTLAFRNGAAGIMLLHNHPGGNPVPSENDLLVTERIGRTGTLTDIPLIDHIILGDNNYFSFKESKLLTDIQD
jgi:DNA repair protein RadC